MSRIRCRPGVDDDIFDLSQYLIGRSEQIARRFVEAVQTSLKEASLRPGAGSPKNFTHPLEEVRTWRVEGFPNHLIYYVPVEDGIEVLAVLHGARNAEPWLKRRL